MLCVWTGKFLNPEGKSCGLKNIRVRVDEAQESHDGRVGKSRRHRKSR